MKSYIVYPFVICLLFLGACKDDDSKVVIADELVPPTIEAPAAGTSIVINEGNMSDAFTVSWSAADYGVDVAVSYTVELDVKDNIFYSPTILATTTETGATITYSELNEQILAELKPTPNEAVQLELRIVAVSTGIDDLYSDVVGITVTTFKDAGVAPVITSPASGASTAITSANLGENYTIKWDAAEFGSSAAITYTVEMAVAGTDFAAPVTVGKVQETELLLKYAALNYYIVGNLAQADATEIAVEFRIKAATASSELFSETSGANVTTLDAQVGQLWIPGGYQGWAPDVAPTIVQKGDHFFDGFVYFDIETGFKFTSNPDWDHTNFGYASDGMLTKDGAADGLTYGPGYFRFSVDTLALTYTYELVESFGLIGTATSGGWDISTDMTYDVDSDTWRITTDLIVGALKFRANNGWGINYGPVDINSKRGTLVFDGASYDVKKAGNYTVILDFNTQNTPYSFNYEIIEN